MELTACCYGGDENALEEKQYRKLEEDYPIQLFLPGKVLCFFLFHKILSSVSKLLHKLCISALLSLQGIPPFLPIFASLPVTILAECVSSSVIKYYTNIFF